MRVDEKPRRNAWALDDGILSQFPFPDRLKDAICPDATHLDGSMPLTRAVEYSYGCWAKNSAQALMRKVITSSAV
jgi:hypothetical protein